MENSNLTPNERLAWALVSFGVALVATVAGVAEQWFLFAPLFLLSAFCVLMSQKGLGKR